MPEISVDVQKSKRSRPRHWGCFKLLLIPIFVITACYGGIWVFARYGGEWIAQMDVPLPLDSQQMRISDYKADYGFTCRLGVYIHEGSPQDLRKWFTDHGISTNAYDEENDDDDYYSNFLDGYEWSLLALLHRTSLSLTSNSYNDMAPPHQLKIFKSKEAFLKYYSEIDLPDGMSAFEAGLCWPNIK